MNPTLPTRHKTRWRGRCTGWATVLTAWLLLGAGAARGGPAPVGVWDFENPLDLLRPTTGVPLQLRGTHISIPGPRPANRAVRIGVGSHYACRHGIAPNGGGTLVNRYSLLLDFRLPTLGPWYCFFQTDPANATDGDCFVRPGDGRLGVGQTGYSPTGLVANRWYRLLVTVDNTRGLHRLYVDGELRLEGNPQSVDGRFGLASTLLLFADEDGEDGALDVARVAVYDTCLGAAEVAELAGVNPPDPANQAPRFLPPASGPTGLATGEEGAFAFRAADPEGGAVSLRVDWGDGTDPADWSAPVASGQAVAFTHGWRQPGDYQVRVLARDTAGTVGGWTDAHRVAVSGAPLVTLLTPPYLQYVRPDGITLMWELDVAVAGEVEYGIPPAFDQRAAATSEPSGAGTTIGRCVLDGLLPGTTYQFRLRHGDREGPGGRFTTAPAGRPDFSFAVWSDSQGSNHGAHPADPLEPTKAMFRHMATNDIALAVTCGDLAEDGSSYGDVRQYYLDRAAALLGVKVPWFVAWGNHDGGAETVIRRFADLPSRLRPGFDAGYGSYSFDYAGCHFVCLDLASIGRDIEGWLAQDLQSAASRTARFTFLAVHVPPFCELWIDGEAALRETLVPLLEAHGVDICFSGHTHEYERGALNGVFYCIAGGGSWLDFPEVLVADWPHMTVGGAHPIPGVVKPGPTRGGGLVNGYVRVDVRGDSFTASLVGFAPDGTPLGTLDQFGKGEPPLVPLRITSAIAVPEGVRIEWSGPAGPCQLQLCLNPATGAWVDYGPVLDPSVRSQVLAAERAAEFFRVRLVAVGDGGVAAEASVAAGEGSGR